MVFSSADLCFTEKRRGAKICREFPGKKWKAKSVNYAIRRLEKLGICCLLTPPITESDPKLEEQILELAESQEENLGSHLAQRKIEQAIVNDYIR